MKKIIHRYDVPFQFLDYLHGFGFKVRGEDEDFNGFHRVNRSSNVHGKIRGSQSLLSTDPLMCNSLIYLRDMLQYSLCGPKPSKDR